MSKSQIKKELKEELKEELKTEIKAETKKRNVIKEEIVEAVSQVKDTVASTTALIISSLTLVAGLAWNEVAKAIFDKLKQYFSGWGEIFGLILYALAVTIVIVFIVSRLKKIKEKIGGKAIK